MLPLSIASAICDLFAVLCAVKMHRRSADTMHIYIAAMGISDLLLTGATYRSFFRFAVLALNDILKVDLAMRFTAV